MLSSFKKLGAALFMAMLAMQLCSIDSFAFMQRKDKTTIFEVPTTGKIIDVTYNREFDEWWVHCREGDDVAVYTYDYRKGIWGKVLFTTKKPEDKGKTQVDRSKEQPAAESQSPQEPQKPDQKVEKKGLTDQKSERKWWDPLKLLTPPDKRNQGKEPTPGSY